ncbi:hypothetical protein HY009_01360 [Candidatus Acetothermia bacterium]|nr:hypothetical protein [Candidatus Acetothermia bacterium]
MPQITLTVTKMGKGRGTVISNESQPKINCGLSCISTYDLGSSVTLLAISNENSVFSGWSGCDFTSSDNFINFCTLQSMNADRAVRATFQGRSAPVIIDKSDASHAFSPNGDGVKDALAISFDVQEAISFPVAWMISIKDSGGIVIKTFQGTLAVNGTVNASWDGKDTTNALVRDGIYRAHIEVANADGRSMTKDFQIFVDRTPPLLVGNRSPEPNTYGWNDTDVIVTFNCTDAGSGIALGPVSPQVVSVEGQGQSRSATCTDNAGNRADLSVNGISIDKTPPSVTITGVRNGVTYSNGYVPVPGCATIDFLSGVATQATATIDPPFAHGLGAHTVTCSGATDRAGNITVTSASYAVGTCVNVSVSYSPRSIIFRPQRLRGDTRTLRVTMMNDSGGPLTVNEIVLDALRLPASSYAISRFSSGLRRGQQYIKPGLPQTVQNGRSLTFFVRVEKTANTGMEKAGAPYFDVSMSCGQLPITQESADREPNEEKISQELSRGIRNGRMEEPRRLELFDLIGRKLVDLRDNQLLWISLPTAAAAYEPLANGIYLVRVVIRGYDGRLMRAVVKKLLILR